MFNENFHHWFKAVFPLLLFYTLFIGIFLAGQLALLAHCHPRIVASGVNYWLAFLIWRMDTIAACIILALPTLVIFLTPPFLRHVAEQLLGSYFLAVLLLAIYIEFATPPFVTEFDAHPNELFVNYQYPREVINTIMATHLALLIFTLVSLVILTFFYRRWRRKSFRQYGKLVLRQRL